VGTHPEDLEAWIQLGELLFHNGPARGRPAEDSREVWYRVAALEPDLVSPIIHLGRLAARAGRLGELDSLERTLAAVRAGRPATEEARSDALELEALRAFATGDQAAQARALAELGTASDLTVVLAAWAVASWTDNFAGALRITDLLTSPRRAPAIRAVGEVMSGTLEVGRGRWEEAKRRFRAADALYPPLGAQYAAYFALAPIGLASEAEALRLAAAIPGPALADTSPATLDLGVYFTIPYRAPAVIRGYLAGLAAATRSASAARQAAATLDRLPSRIGSPAPAFLAAGIRAEAAWRWGSAEEARAVLDTAAFRAWYLDASASPFVAGLRERWRHAEALERVGRLDEAAVRFNSFTDFTVFDAAFLAPAERRLALLEQQRGDSAAARRHWSRFAALWKDADPALQPLVAEARAP
jgi:hypothetical protein